ncbi:MAG: methylated-DNA--[protein]-cysteine S-methyltransferase [Holophagaceae bacterium]|nr:methylated-DNA--[protein]-cysteine S-methyltransferase [Holophagaceae bacterium]
MLIIPTPLGDLDASFDVNGSLTRLMFVPPATAIEGDMNEAQSHTARLLAKELYDYFSGTLKVFSIPIAPAGTSFQLQVWDRLLAIPYGTITTYGQIAVELGGANLARAVGRANGTNPIFLLIPCHRVIGANGQLTGYAGGLDRKAGLLQLEKAIVSRSIQSQPQLFSDN